MYIFPTWVDIPSGTFFSKSSTRKIQRWGSEVWHEISRMGRGLVMVSPVVSGANSPTNLGEPPTMRSFLGGNKHGASTD